jgi:hypothetical protein
VVCNELIVLEDERWLFLNRCNVFVIDDLCLSDQLRTRGARESHFILDFGPRKALCQVLNFPQIDPINANIDQGARGWLSCLPASQHGFFADHKISLIGLILEFLMLVILVSFGEKVTDVGSRRNYQYTRNGSNGQSAIVGG